MRTLSLLLVAIAVLAAGHARADCDGPPPWWGDGDPEEDQTPPTAPKVRGVEVRRFTRPVLDDASGWGATSCGTPRDGWVIVRLDPSTDDQTPQMEIGYVVEHVGGHLPDHVLVDDEPMVLSSDRKLWIRQTGDDDDEVLDFRLRLVPIDAAGNRGPPSEPFRVYDEGVGCSAAGSGLGLPGLLAVLALLRRRR